MPATSASLAGVVTGFSTYRYAGFLVNHVKGPLWITLPETNITPENQGAPSKRRFRTWKPVIFRGELLVLGSVYMETFLLYVVKCYPINVNSPFAYILEMTAR